MDGVVADQGDLVARSEVVVKSPGLGDGHYEGTIAHRDKSALS